MRIGLLEDDADQANVVQQWLVDAGHSVEAFLNADAFMRVAARETFDLFLLDWMLPGKCGDEVLAWLREQRGADTPVMFVTSRDAEEDIVAALRSGADDYLVKPVRRFELLARAEALWRRSRPRSEESRVLDHPPFRLDLEGRVASVQGEPVDLTEREFELAAFLFRNLGRLVSRSHLLAAVWGKSVDISTRTIDTHISRLRGKLRLRPENGLRLSSIYNCGYRLERMSPDHLPD